MGKNKLQSPLNYELRMITQMKVASQYEWDSVEFAPKNGRRVEPVLKKLENQPNYARLQNSNFGRE